MPLQQMTFENMLAKGEIAQNEQFLHLPKSFQLFSVIVPSFIKIFEEFANILSK